MELTNLFYNKRIKKGEVFGKHEKGDALGNITQGEKLNLNSRETTKTWRQVVMRNRKGKICYEGPRVEYKKTLEETVLERIQNKKFTRTTAGTTSLQTSGEFLEAELRVARHGFHGRQKYSGSVPFERFRTASLANRITCWKRFVEHPKVCYMDEHDLYDLSRGNTPPSQDTHPISRDNDIGDRWEFERPPIPGVTFASDRPPNDIILHPDRVQLPTENMSKINQFRFLNDTRF